MQDIGKVKDTGRRDSSTVISSRKRFAGGRVAAGLDGGIEAAIPLGLMSLVLWSCVNECREMM